MIVEKAEFQELKKTKTLKSNANIDLLNGVETNLIMKFGEKTMDIKEVLNFKPGYLIELDKSTSEGFVDICIGEKKLATGEIVVIGDSFGIRILDVEKTQKNHN